LLKDSRVQEPKCKGLAAGSNYAMFNIDMFESQDKGYERFQQAIL